MRRAIQYDADSFAERIGPVEQGDGALYGRLASTIAAAVTARRLSPGDRLPAERELAVRLKVSRDTLRQALKRLEQHGQVVRTVGRSGGTFVAAPKVGRTGLAGGARVLSARERTAGPAIAGALGIEAGARVYEIVRVRLAGGRPAALEKACYAAERLPGLLAHPLDGSLYTILREAYGEVPVRAVEYLEAILAGPEEATALEVEEGAPLMFVERVAFDRAGTPMEFSRDVFRGDRTRVVLWEDDSPL